MPDRICRLAGSYYLLAAVALTMWLWRDPASRVAAVNPYDADQFSWFLRYDATAVAHLRLPSLTSTGMNAPHGFNLMWNTPMLLPGIVLAPVTLLAGPQTSLTLLLTLGFAGSALAMFAVARAWGASTLAAACAGPVYGFSPALVQSALGHYDLQFAVLPPLIVDAALRIATGRARRFPGRRVPGSETRWGTIGWGAWLGLASVVQIFFTEEVLFDSAVAIVLILAVLAASRPRAIRESAGRILAGAGTAAATILALAGYPLWEQFAGPIREHGSPFIPDYYENDLAGFVRAPGTLLLHTPGSAAFAKAFPGELPEYLAYLGWPMLIVLAVIAVLWWRRLPVRVTAVTFAVLSVASLGGTLMADGHQHSWFELPWFWVQSLPIVGSVIPDRFSILADGAAAALFAFGLDATRSRWTVRRAPDETVSAGAGTAGRGLRRHLGRLNPRWVIAGVAIVALAPLLPRPLSAGALVPPPAGWQQTFSTLRLPASAPVLVVPVPMSSFTEPLRWAADTGTPSSMIGGYFTGPNPLGQAAIDGAGTPGADLYLNRMWTRPNGPVALADTPGQTLLYTAQIRRQLVATGAAAVVADASPKSALGIYLISVLGRPALRTGAVLAWRLDPRQ
ncbi:MAG TPA: hypothetical protein VGG75_10020 [Trebonia sp.]